VTIGIIACVEVGTTTTTPLTTATSTSALPITTPGTTSTASGTTTIPTSAQTTSNCQVNMAQIGTVFVSSVTYSVTPVQGPNGNDLTHPNGNGVDFPQPQGTTGLFDQNNKPLYTIDITFNPSGVNSLSSITVNKNTNVGEFSVEFFALSNPTTLIPSPNQAGVPLSYTSSPVNDIASINNFPQNAPSDLSGIRITILSTTDNQ
jgi:hypothetical protein